MNSTLPNVNASANLCGRTSRMGGETKMNEKRKHSALPAKHARNPMKLASEPRLYIPLPMAQTNIGFFFVGALSTAQGHIARKAAAKV